jgi:hypothetical protein
VKRARPAKTIGKKKIVDAVYVPTEQLVDRYATTYSFDPTRLAAVLFQFGPLPNSGQEQLIRCLVPARSRFQLTTVREEGGLLEVGGHATFTQERKQLEAIEATTKKLLLLLGVNPANVNVVPQALWDRSERPPLEQLRTLGQQDEEKWGVMIRLASAKIDLAEKDRINAQLTDTGNRIASAIAGLLFLHRQANAAASAARNRVSPGRGGLRHRPSGKGQLVRNAIAIYVLMRQNFPRSGPEPGFGGPMERFVVAVGTLFGTQLSEADIRGAWRVRKSFLKEN